MPLAFTAPLCRPALLEPLGAALTLPPPPLTVDPIIPPGAVAIFPRVSIGVTIALTQSLPLLTLVGAPGVTITASSIAPLPINAHAFTAQSRIPVVTAALRPLETITARRQVPRTPRPRALLTALPARHAFLPTLALPPGVPRPCRGPPPCVFRIQAFASCAFTRLLRRPQLLLLLALTRLLCGPLPGLLCRPLALTVLLRGTLASLLGSPLSPFGSVAPLLVGGIGVALRTLALLALLALLTLALALLALALALLALALALALLALTLTLALLALASFTAPLTVTASPLPISTPALALDFLRRLDVMQDRRTRTGHVTEPSPGPRRHRWRANTQRPARGKRHGT